MKSNKQRRAEILEHRRKREAKVAVLRRDEREKELRKREIPPTAPSQRSDRVYLYGTIA